MLVISKIACDITRSHIIIELLTKIFHIIYLKNVPKPPFTTGVTKIGPKAAEIFLMTAKH